MIAKPRSKRVNMTRNPARDSDPTWSSDGKWIAFVSERDGNSEIYRMNAKNGTGLRRLTNSLAVDLVPNHWHNFKR